MLYLPKVPWRIIRVIKMTSIEEIINDIMELNTMRMNGEPEWKIHEVAMKQCKRYDWLF